MHLLDEFNRHNQSAVELLEPKAVHAAVEQNLRQVARYSTPGVPVLVLAVFVLAAVSGDLAVNATRSTFACVAILLTGSWRWYGARRLLRPEARLSSKDEMFFALGVLSTPLVWVGYAASVVYTDPGGLSTPLALCFSAALCSSALPTFGLWVRLCLGYVLALNIPLALLGILMGDAFGWGLLLVSVFFMAFCTAQAKRINSALWQGQIDNLVLDAKSHELEDAKLAAEVANRTKSEFLARMSHELRTPMNAVLGFAQIINRSSEATETLRAHSKQIIESGNYLTSLINEILDLAKVEAGRITLELSEVDIAALSKSVSDSLRAALRGGVLLNFSVEDGLPRIQSDPIRLRQVLVNLVGNAIKFTDAGRVDVDLGVEGGEIHIRVRDTGIGISAADLGHIFDPFVQVDQSSTRRYGGTGLGLPISRQLVEMMGGRILVESAEGKGSCFTVCLPLARPAED